MPAAPVEFGVFAVSSPGPPTAMERPSPPLTAAILADNENIDPFDSLEPFTASQDGGC